MEDFLPKLPGHTVSQFTPKSSNNLLPKIATIKTVLQYLSLKPLKLWRWIGRRFTLKKHLSSGLLQFKLYFKKGQSRPLFCSFSSFSQSNNKQSVNVDYINSKQRRCCAWDSNPGRQDCRRRFQQKKSFNPFDNFQPIKKTTSVQWNSPSYSNFILGCWPYKLATPY